MSIHTFNLSPLKRFKLILCLCGLLSSFSAIYSQQVDSSKVQIDLSATGSFQQGNFQRLQLIGKGDLTYGISSKWELLSRHLYIYQRIFGNQTQNDYLNRNFLTYRINKYWDTFAATFYETYFIKGIRSYAQAGLGSRLRIIDKKRIQAQIGFMLSLGQKNYVASDFFEFENNGQSSLTAVNLTPVLVLKVEILPKKALLNLLAWFQQDALQTENWRYVAEANLQLPLSHRLQATLRANQFYENINLVGIQPNDFLLTAGVSYQLGNTHEARK